MLKSAILGTFLTAVIIAAELTENLQESVNSFSLLLLKETLKEEKGDVLISPLGIHSLLSIIQHGASADTQHKLDNILQASSTDTRQAFFNITTSIEDADSIESLRFWSYGKMKDLHPFNPTIEDILYQDYVSRFNAHQLPYYKEGNISLRTDIFLSDKASKEEFFELVNLISFYSLWAHSRLSHKNITFSSSPDEEVRVRAISMKRLCPSGESLDLGAKWVQIPLAIKKPCACRNKPAAEEYYSTRNISLLLVLPTERHGLEKLVQKLTTEDVTNIINHSTNPDDWEGVHITLPPFNINTSINFIPYLRKIGLGDLFEESADLSGFSTFQRLYVSQVAQTGQFIVDEYGVRTKLYSDFSFPAVFNAYGNGNTTLREFNLDEPFLYFVVDEVNTIPLLMGRVVRPVARNWNPFRERELRHKKLS